MNSDAPHPASPALARMGSLDAYRGFVMFLMMAEVLELARMVEAFPQSDFWRTLAFHQDHVKWVGCSLHDLIQPSFSFLVGAALPFSLARRSAEGQPLWWRTVHAFWRAFVLVLLGVFLRSLDSKSTYWTFEDTLSQIGLGYGFLYLLANASTRIQWAGFGILMVGYWAFFAMHPMPAGSTTFSDHWALNTNAAWAFDMKFLNWFHRPNGIPFTGNGGGYSTLSFIPTLATMILGLVAGRVLIGETSASRKISWLVTAGAVSLAGGWLLGATGICPIVKRIWTPAWVLWSGGTCFLFLAGFYLVIDHWKLRRWAGVFIVIGMNSIAAYLIAHLFVEFIRGGLVRHLGGEFFQSPDHSYDTLRLGAAVLFVEILLLWWMHRRKIFLRI